MCNSYALSHLSENEILKISEICKKSNVKLFEDCAISLGGTVNNFSVGELSDGGIFSFSAFKALNYFWGGGLVINDKQSWVENSELIDSLPCLLNRHYLSRIPSTLKYDLLTRGMFFYFIFKIFVLVNKFRKVKATMSIFQILE